MREGNLLEAPATVQVRDDALARQWREENPFERYTQYRVDRVWKKGDREEGAIHLISHPNNPAM